MKMSTVLIVVAVALAGFLIYVGAKPNHMEFSREMKIAATPTKIFPFLNRTELANSWNPWLKMDPAAHISVSGPAEGVGAKTSWEGGKQLGTGSATIIESVPGERVKIKLEYTKPFEMTQDAFYLMNPSGNETVVTWKVEGKNNFLSRLMCTFFDMDKMMNDTFMKGLSDLKALAER